MRILCALIVLAFTATAASAQTAPPATVAAPSDVAAPPATATKTASGLATRVLAPGKGTDHPGKDDVVTIHYTGWKTDGTMFDSSVARGKPCTVRKLARDQEITDAVIESDRGQQQRHELPAAKGIKHQRGQRQPDHRGQIAAAAEHEIAQQGDRQEQENEGVGIEEHRAFPGGAEKPNHTT